MIRHVILNSETLSQRALFVNFRGNALPAQNSQSQFDKLGDYSRTGGAKADIVREVVWI